MVLLNKINAEGTDFGVALKVPVGACDVPAGTQIKTATFSDTFELSAGNIVSVKFTYANTYGDGTTTYPLLKVDDLSYPIRIASSGSYAKSGDWAALATKLFLFDGDSFLML